MRTRTKIIATLGPSSASAPAVERLVRAGMSAARLNFSHGTHAAHARLFRAARAAGRATGEHVAVIADLQGPRIRVGVVAEGGIDLRAGETVTLPVTCARLYRDVRPGERVLIDDGAIEATYVSGTAGKAVLRVSTGGRLTSHKGMNFPDSTLRLSAITAKDREDLAFALSLGVDWVALSFVASAADVTRLRRLMIRMRGKKASHSVPKIIAKIERREALENFDGILAAADAVMVARGDLAIETSLAEVPIRQKEITERCRVAGTPVIVATQMLDSMIRNPRPTRAEVSDVANAVCDHADALMLSGETAAGKYPRQAVAMMSRVAAETEASAFDDVEGRAFGAAEAIVIAAESADDAGAIVAGRPEAAVYLACPDAATARQHAIRWGVRAFVLSSKDASSFALDACASLRAARLLKRGTHVAVVTGSGIEAARVA